MLHPTPASQDATFSLEEAALRLDVSEASIREWLASFNWERRYDGAGRLRLAERDLEFFRLAKSLKDADRSCQSIARMIKPEPEAPVQVPAIDEMASLKAELRALHNSAKRPFWKFWAR